MNIGPITNPTKFPPHPEIISASTNNVNFDALHYNVEPFILYRPLNLYQRWLAIILVKKNDPNYNHLQTFISHLTSTLDIGSSTSFTMLEDSSKFGSISKHKWYSIDLRDEQDSSIKNLIQYDTKKHQLITKWMKNLYFDKLYNKTKGLVIYADSLEDVPEVLISRSTFGLCTLSGKELAQFIFNCTCKLLCENIPTNKENKIIGYINSHKWMKLVEI